MKKLITLVGRLVLFAAAIFAASPCLGKIYEPELPESMYKEQKIKERRR
ncbi:MAG: cyclic lactone autoinducer peptide [Lachnospiraceae bacterium]|nr:cyclic lactone autoinducer peptide [Lachnospiraceae bacterium]